MTRGSNSHVFIVDRPTTVIQYNTIQYNTTLISTLNGISEISPMLGRVHSGLGMVPSRLGWTLLDTERTLSCPERALAGLG